MRGMPGSPVSNDEQILANVKACRLAITTRCHDFLKSTDSEVFLRGARAFTLTVPTDQAGIVLEFARAALGDSERGGGRSSRRQDSPQPLPLAVPERGRMGH